MFQKILFSPKVEHTLSLSPSIDSVLLHTFIDFSTTTGHYTLCFIMIQFQCCDILFVLPFHIKDETQIIWSVIIHCFSHENHFKWLFTHSTSNTSYMLLTFIVSVLWHISMAISLAPSQTHSVFYHYLGFQICDMVQVFLNLFKVKCTL